MIVREQQQAGRFLVESPHGRQPFPFFSEQVEDSLLSALIRACCDNSTRFVKKKIAERPPFQHLVLQLNTVSIQIDPAMWIRFHRSIDDDGSTFYQADCLRPGRDTEL
jgi:hypothetical protein